MTKTEPPILLTPGPLTTSDQTRQAMLRDWGSRDDDFIAMSARVCARLVTLAGGDGSHVCVPVQGSGTFAVEAAVGTLVPRDGKALILVNGAYGTRIGRMCDAMGRAYLTLETPEDVPTASEDVDRLLAADPDISHVIAVHCETTAGILNPISDIAQTVATHNRALIIDAMSAFGALPFDLADSPADAIVSSANKCLEGVPGVAFAIVREEALTAAAGNALALSLDLYDQWQAMAATGQWRFTPPTHVIAALDAALTQHEAEGGVEGRGARYRRNCKVLIDGMTGMGFRTFLPDNLQAPIIVTFHMPGHSNFAFDKFYDLLRDRGIVIYPGKLTQVDSFRIGCIGALDESHMRRALDAVRAVLGEMNVGDGAPSS
jgi:2-aminoethylphosphonate-pyruvate transaminase